MTNNRRPSSTLCTTTQALGWPRSMRCEESTALLIHAPDVVKEINSSRPWIGVVVSHAVSNAVQIFLAAL